MNHMDICTSVRASFSSWEIVQDDIVFAFIWFYVSSRCVGPELIRVLFHRYLRYHTWTWAFVRLLKPSPTNSCEYRQIMYHFSRWTISTFARQSESFSWMEIGTRRYYLRIIWLVFFLTVLHLSSFFGRVLFADYIYAPRHRHIGHLLLKSRYLPHDITH